MPKAIGTTPKEPTGLPPHKIKERQMKRGYRAMAKINLAECGCGGDSLADYEKWLKEISTAENK
ncbi:hypothetical protein FACS1894211_10250 [Clostridia bacterium]|nr:hypothetical protein FACS1894211_10250 [Clostridia bacterium]